jgi:hypothetical protein
MDALIGVTHFFWDIKNKTTQLNKLFTSNTLCVQSTTHSPYQYPSFQLEK